MLNNCLNLYEYLLLLKFPFEEEGIQEQEKKNFSPTASATTTCKRTLKRNIYFCPLLYCRSELALCPQEKALWWHECDTPYSIMNFRILINALCWLKMYWGSLNFYWLLMLKSLLYTTIACKKNTYSGKGLIITTFTYLLLKILKHWYILLIYCT